MDMTFGYYGKLPFAGDFLRHGLSAAFVSGWDAWMQRVLLMASETEGETRWQSLYLCAPIWRFSIAPGRLASHGAVGVLMPSLDRVGRRFPFCIAAATDLPPVAAYLALQPVAERLEAIALDMIEGEGGLSTLDARLAQLPSLSPLQHVAGLGQGVGSLWIATVMDQARVMLAPHVPTRPDEAAALFNPDASYWTHAALTGSET
ncbi:type VI secretion system-associated protein TagF [uncultured Tateyamaria sp.]|uniref:type VI secretion system-associated protein TagF n=1 Tax=uncultured Tateyamaria sp. TaxID=455651 RepID=UPI002622A695|nr:type VI secretion system-associated protein TagF [uncultured Tateyamaria sp.]